MGEWTAITSGQTDEDSAFDETLADGLRDHCIYNHDHAIRCGTHSSGERLTLARCLEAFNATSCIANKEFTGTVTFSTGSDDGNPNFDAAPRVIFGFHQYTEGYDAWSAANNIYRWSAVVTSISDSGFDWRVQFYNLAGVDIAGYFHWAAVGPVTAGE